MNESRYVLCIAGVGPKQTSVDVCWVRQAASAHARLCQRRLHGPQRLERYLPSSHFTGERDVAQR